MAGWPSLRSIPWRRPPTESDETSGGESATPGVVTTTARTIAGEEREEGRGERPRDRPPRGLLVAGLLLGLLLVLTVASQNGLSRPFTQRPLDLMEFERLLRKNEVAEVRFKELTALVTLRAGNLRADREGTRMSVLFNSPEGVEEEVKLIRELSAEDRADRISTVVHQEPTNAVLDQLLAWSCRRSSSWASWTSSSSARCAGRAGPGRSSTSGRAATAWPASGPR